MYGFLGGKEEGICWELVGWTDTGNGVFVEETGVGVSQNLDYEAWVLSMYFVYHISMRVFPFIHGWMGGNLWDLNRIGFTFSQQPAGV